MAGQHASRAEGTWHPCRTSRHVSTCSARSCGAASTTPPAAASATTAGEGCPRPGYPVSPGGGGSVRAEEREGLAREEDEDLAEGCSGASPSWWGGFKGSVCGLR